MSGSEQDGPLVVWRMPVPRKQNGRYMWPPEIKAMAAERVAAGETVAAIAREIPANESVIGKWVLGRRDCGQSQNCQAGLVEVVAVIDGEHPGTATAAGVVTCDIQIGDVRLTIGPGYPAAHLAEILRAVRASQ